MVFKVLDPGRQRRHRGGTRQDKKAGDVGASATGFLVGRHEVTQALL